MLLFPAFSKKFIFVLRVSFSAPTRVVKIYFCSDVDSLLSVIDLSSTLSIVFSKLNSEACKDLLETFIGSTTGSVDSEFSNTISSLTSDAIDSFGSICTSSTLDVVIFFNFHLKLRQLLL